MGGFRNGDFTTLGEFEDLVDQHLLERKSDSARKILVGMLFMREGESLTDKEIKPQLDYFHGRSSNYIDFYLAGWKLFQKPEGVAGTRWEFNVDNFLKAQDAIESETE